MKKFFLTTIIVLNSFISLQAHKIKGSDTMLPLSQKISEQYMQDNPSTIITVTGGGSGVGITALIDGTTDIAQSSRKIKFDEKQKIQEKGKIVKEIVVAYDALAIIIHPSNKIKSLTREQLEGIFRGKIKNWREVGGDNLKIIPYSREVSSGTYEFFKENILQNKNYMNGIMSMPATGILIQSVGQTKGAISYVGLAYLNKDIKTISISYNNEESIKPSIGNIKNRSYPIVRPLYYYYVTSSEKRVRPFINYVLSTKGQSIISKIGFIPISLYFQTNLRQKMPIKNQKLNY